jgi:hypothetical protein
LLEAASGGQSWKRESPQVFGHRSELRQAADAISALWSLFITARGPCPSLFSTFTSTRDQLSFDLQPFPQRPVILE